VTARSAAVAIIPVRVQSQRLPRKALRADSGQPLFLHTYQQARRARCFAQVYVATDSDEVVAAAERAGAATVRTSPAARTGSERCAEAAARIPGRIFVDIQGDWPEIDPRDLERLTAAIEQGAPAATLAVPLTDPVRLADPDVVKVVRARDGNALYFSRSPIPYRRGESQLVPLRHIGVYAFTRDVLLRLPAMPSSGLAEAEGLEQLRWLENGIATQVVETEREPWGIENESDYLAFLERLAQRGGVPKS
jgi:3-deoxy-manno-octulosonate cytidylyltransferase (CMP-KDO synthetase)